MRGLKWIRAGLVSRPTPTKSIRGLHGILQTLAAKSSHQNKDSHIGIGDRVIHWASKDYVIKDYLIFEFGFDERFGVASPHEGSHVNMQSMEGDPQPVGYVIDIKWSQNDTPDILIPWDTHDGGDTVATL